MLDDDLLRFLGEGDKRAFEGMIQVTGLTFIVSILSNVFEENSMMTSEKLLFAVSIIVQMMTTTIDPGLIIDEVKRAVTEHFGRDKQFLDDSDTLWTSK